MPRFPNPAIAMLAFGLILAAPTLDGKGVRAAGKAPFAAFAEQILDGLNATKLARLPAISGYGVPRIAVRTIDRDGALQPGSSAADYTRRMLEALHLRARDRFRFVALDALDALILEIRAKGLPPEETRSRIEELRVNAQADVLVAGFIRKDRGATVLSYQAINVASGELLAATSPRPLWPGPVAVDQDNVPAATPSPQGPYRATVEEAERLLFDKGYDPGPVDGYLTEETRSALRAYQLDSALPVNGRLTRRVVKNLRRDSRRLVF